MSSVKDRPPKVLFDLNELGVPGANLAPGTANVRLGLLAFISGETGMLGPVSDQIDWMSLRREGAGTEREYRW